MPFKDGSGGSLLSDEGPNAGEACGVLGKAEGTYAGEAGGTEEGGAEGTYAGELGGTEEGGAEGTYAGELGGGELGGKILFGDSTISGIDCGEYPGSPNIGPFSAFKSIEDCGVIFEAFGT